MLTAALVIAVASACSDGGGGTEVGLVSSGDEVSGVAEQPIGDEAASATQAGSGLTTADYGPSEPSDPANPADPTDPPDPVEPVDPPALAGTIEALTYNVAGLPDALSGSNPEVNTTLIGERLNRFDLVLLQESWQTPKPNPNAPLRTYHEDLEATSTLPFRSIPLAAPLGSDPDRPQALLSDGLNRFSTLAFEPTLRQRWSGCGDAAADCLALKGFSMARTTVAPGVTVDVYNLHMEAGGADFALRGENVAELLAFVTANSVGEAVVVGGDFNLHLDEEPDATQFADLLAGAELTDVCTELGCDQPNRIDKFLYRSSSRVTISPTSWQNLTADFERDDGSPLSDHDPVAVTFDWTIAASE